MATNNSTLPKMTNYRWVICAMLFMATTINYMDRQVLSLTWKDFIAPEFHWTDSTYGNVAAIFSLVYAVANLLSGRFMDRIGTRRGYLWAIGIWSLGACLHAVCGLATIGWLDLGGREDLFNATGALAVSIASVSAWFFIIARIVLAVGESGNFPAAIKVTAEYFPKKDRAFSTSIFNSGASIGALAAPLTIPVLAKAYGWEMSFIIIGAIGFVWMFFWHFIYDKPQNSKHVNEAELAYINQDEQQEEKTVKEEQKDERVIPFLKCFTYRQTWSFIAGKFFTDGVWWFYLFWAPAYFSDQFGYKTSDPMGQALIFVLYLIVTVLSIFGGYLPKYFVEKKGMEPYAGRMIAMLIFAFFPLFALFAQPLGESSAWYPAIIIGLAGAGHQAWSANLFSTTGDMFPKSTIATITGIGAMAGGLGSLIINKGAGALFTYAETQGSAFTFLSFEGKPAGYMIIFCICAVAYLVAWACMKLLVPTYKPIKA